MYLEKVVVLGQSGFIRAKVVVFGQKWLYSDKIAVVGQSGCIRECDCIPTNWLFSVKVLVFG